MQVKEKVYIKRECQNKTWKQIAAEVKNLKGKRPCWKIVRAAFWELAADKGMAKKG